MNTKYVNKFAFWLPSILLTLVFCNCNNDEGLPVYDITGEWLGTYSDDNQVVMTTVEFTSGGAYKEWIAYISKEDNSNIDREGTFLNDGKIDIVYSVKNVEQYYPRQFHKIWRIVKCDKYVLRIYDETAGEEQTYRKVVDIYNMNLGEQRVINITDVNFHALDYKSCDERVATVDQYGNIYAIKRGTTYIRVISADSEIVVRVEVNDKNNLIDDYTMFIGEPINYAVNSFGPIYNETPLKDGTTFLTFNIIDNKLKRLYFHYFVEDRVYKIEGDFLDGTDLTQIIEVFKEKYITLGSEKEHVHYYLSQGNHDILITIYDEMRIIEYELLPNDFEKYDAIIKKNIDEVSEWLKLPLKDVYVKFDERAKDSLMSTGYRNNKFEYFQDIVFLYYRNSRDIASINLKCPKGIALSEVEEWYDKKYIIHYPNGKKSYATTNNYLMSEYYINIYKESDQVNVQYISHKATSK